MLQNENISTVEEVHQRLEQLSSKKCCHLSLLQVQFFCNRMASSNIVPPNIILPKIISPYVIQPNIIQPNVILSNIILQKFVNCKNHCTEKFWKCEFHEFFNSQKLPKFLFSFLQVTKVTKSVSAIHINVFNSSSNHVNLLLTYPNQTKLADYLYF